MTERRRPRVVVVGAGFGGLWAVRHLQKAPVDVLVIDRNNYHTFYPLLYQVGTAELEPEQIAYPVRRILRKMSNTSFAMGEITSIDFGQKVVRCGPHNLSYDYLVLATGSASFFFNIPGASSNALPLRSLEEGVTVRNHILSRFEQAAVEPDVERRQPLLTFAVVGGGPTGVEFTGALAELIYGPVKKDFPTIDFGEVRVMLLEALDSLLPGMPEKLVSYTTKRLQSKGVEVRTGALATEITDEVVRLKDGDVIPTATVIWTAGVRASTLIDAVGLPTNKRGQVEVLPTLQAPGHPDVYVVGDSAFAQQDGRPLPMVAPVAMQQGETAARNILRAIRGEELQPFHYNDRGMLAVVGRNAAVADLGRVKFTGFFAWLLWLGVHIYRLIGFRNRLQVLINWAWAYILFERAVRLILPNRPSRGPDEQGQAGREYATETSREQ